jgi:hypothetical protein
MTDGGVHTQPQLKFSKKKINLIDILNQTAYILKACLNELKLNAKLSHILALMQMLKFFSLG